MNLFTFNSKIPKGPCKRTQQVTTLLRVVGGFWPTMLRPFAWAQKFDRFQTIRNKCQHCCGSTQTDATCWAQKCCVRLHGSQGGGTAVEVHCYPHYYVTAVTIDTTVTAVYLTVLRQQWPRQHCDGDGSNIRVSAMQNDNATTTMTMTTL